MNQARKGDTGMQFTVREWMNELVVYVDPEVSVADALALMRRRYIHSLLVRKTEQNPEYGIITSTDVCDKIVAQDRNPNEVKVKEVMTSPLIMAAQEMTLRECAQTMHKNSIHHIPVVDVKGEIVGMISDTDFLVAAEAMGRPTGDRLE
jgi:signal-transduction protein with cAMP-binding, CBS, and nucleotidyltransferase domain